MFVIMRVCLCADHCVCAPSDLDLLCSGYCVQYSTEFRALFCTSLCVHQTWSCVLCSAVFGLVVLRVLCAVHHHVCICQTWSCVQGTGFCTLLSLYSVRQGLVCVQGTGFCTLLFLYFIRQGLLCVQGIVFCTSTEYVFHQTWSRPEVILHSWQDAKIHLQSCVSGQCLGNMKELLPDGNVGSGIETHPRRDELMSKKGQNDITQRPSRIFWSNWRTLRRGRILCSRHQRGIFHSFDKRYGDFWGGTVGVGDGGNASWLTQWTVVYCCVTPMTSV